MLYNFMFYMSNLCNFIVFISLFQTQMQVHFNHYFVTTHSITQNGRSWKGPLGII